MKPFTEPSAYRDTMSPMWRKLDLCSDIFVTEELLKMCSGFPFKRLVLLFGWSKFKRYSVSNSAAVFILPLLHFSQSIQKNRKRNKTTNCRRFFSVFRLIQLLPVCQADPERALLHIHFRGRRLLLSGLWANSVLRHVFIQSRPSEKKYSFIQWLTEEF